MDVIKGELCHFKEEVQTHNFNIYGIDKEIILILNISNFHELFSEETKVPRTFFEARKVEGIKYEVVLSFKVSLCVQFIQP